MWIRPNIGVNRLSKNKFRGKPNASSKLNLNFAQSGSLMVEAIGMLGLIAITTPVLFKKSIERQNELTDIAIANQTRTLIDSLQSFVAEYKTSIKSCITSINGGVDPQVDAALLATCRQSGLDIDEYKDGTTSWEVDLASVNFTKNLPTGFSGDNKLVTYKAAIKVDNATTTPTVTGMIVSSKTSDTTSSLRGARIATMIGVSGGYVAPGAVVSDATVPAQGASGAWKLKVKEFFPNDIVGFTYGDSSIVGVTGYSEVVGTGSGGGGDGDCDDCLYRGVKDGNPQYNTMATNIYMGSENADGSLNGPHSIFSYVPDTDNWNSYTTGAEEIGGQIDYRSISGEYTDGSETESDSGATGSSEQNKYADIIDATGAKVSGTGRDLPKYQFFVNTAVKTLAFVPKNASSTIRGIAKTTEQQAEQLKGINDTTVALSKNIVSREGELRLGYFEGGYFLNPTTDQFEYIPPGAKGVKGGSVANIHVYSTKGDGDKIVSNADVYEGRKSGNLYLHEGGRVIVNAPEAIGDEYVKTGAASARVSNYDSSAAPGSVNVYSNQSYSVDLNGDGDTSDAGETIPATGLYDQSLRSTLNDTLSVHQKSGGISLKKGSSVNHSGSIDVEGGQIRMEGGSETESGTIYLRRNTAGSATSNSNLYLLGNDKDATNPSGDVKIEGGRLMLLHTESFSSNPTYNIENDDQRGSIYVHGGQVVVKEDNPTGTGGIGTEEYSKGTATFGYSANTASPDFAYSLSGVKFSSGTASVDSITQASVGALKTYSDYPYDYQVSKGAIRLEGSDKNFSGQMHIVGGTGYDAGALIVDGAYYDSVSSSYKNSKNGKILMLNQGDMLDKNGDGVFNKDDLKNTNNFKVGLLSTAPADPTAFDKDNYEFYGLEVPEFHNADMYQFKIDAGNVVGDAADATNVGGGAGNMVIAGGRGASSGVLRVYGGWNNATYENDGANSGQVRLYGTSSYGSGSLVTYGSSGKGTGAINMFAGSGVGSGNLNMVARDTRYIVPGGDNKQLRGGNINLEGGNVNLNTQSYPTWAALNDELAAARLLVSSGNCAPTATVPDCGLLLDDTVSGGVKVSVSATLQAAYNTYFAGQSKAGNLTVGTGGATTLNGTLGVSGLSTFSNDVNVSSSSLKITENPGAADQVNMALNPSKIAEGAYTVDVMRGPVMGKTTGTSPDKRMNTQAKGPPKWIDPPAQTTCAQYLRCQYWNTVGGWAWNTPSGPGFILVCSGYSWLWVSTGITQTFTSTSCPANTEDKSYCPWNGSNYTWCRALQWSWTVSSIFFRR